MDDASLDDFLDTGAESDEDGEPEADVVSDEEVEPETDAEPEADAEAGEDGAPETDAEIAPAEDGTDPVVVPATSTMTSSPDGVECAACGERVRRRWTDGDTLVCRDCKEW